MNTIVLVTNITNYILRFNGDANFIATNFMFFYAISFVFNDVPFKGKGIPIHIIDFLLTSLASLIILTVLDLFIPDLILTIEIYAPIICIAHAFIMNKYTLMNRICKTLTLTTTLVLTFRISLDLGFVLNLTWQDMFITIIALCIGVFFLKAYDVGEYNRMLLPCLIGEIVVLAFEYDVSLVFNGTIQDNNYVLYSAVTSIAMYVINLILYYFICTIFKYFQKSVDQQALLLKSINDHETQKISNQNMETLREMRHDMKNQYEYMRLLLEKKDYDTLGKFFSDLSEHAFVPLHYIDCGNSCISGILNIETGKAKENSITINSKAIVPSSLDISDYDMSRFLMNVLDNAIEACTNDGIPNAEISAEISYTDPYVVFKITNPVTDRLNEEERLSDKSTKDNPLIHGYGTKIINEVIKKYNGKIKKEIMDGQFIVTAMLQNMYVKENNE